ncbi:peroxidase 64-like [Olea europaea subsp. europaea]|uniref:Peroxidase n=1 Tax=Olea europaea subsp. europaea TaxID=158383 RepID=A0A8S0T4T6_OLEEU|nr:peroxidase 64-like [Olea europaea subsp. europaea]
MLMHLSLIINTLISIFLFQIPMAFVVALLFCSAIFFSSFSQGNALSLNYYTKTCPDVEYVIAQVVREATMKDKTVPAALLRMHFHDCFIRVIKYFHLIYGFFLFFFWANLFDLLKGCDGSVLLNSKGGNKAEKDGPPNVSLHAFYVIDSAKKAVEAKCPGIVSCADILALAARDAVVLAGGPTWDVPKGRKDGRISKASETVQLPAPTFNISQLQQSFSQRGLSMEDLVALSGGHTLGFSHCSSFQNRLHNFNSTHDIDPTLHPSIAASLRSICPIKNKAKNAGTNMDPSSATFDNNYYKLTLQKKSLFSSDQALLTIPKTKDLVSKYASSKEAFNTAFVNSMIKMSSITGGQEVRKDCRVVN